MATARAILEIITDASGMDKGIGHATGKLLDLKGAVKDVGKLLAGAFAISSIASAATDVVNFAGDLTDMSVKTGLGTTALQELKYAGSQVGVELETITGGVTQLQKRIAGGDASAVGAMGALGLSFDDLRDKSPEDQFKAIAAEVAKVEDPADRVKLAMDLFGKSGAEMLPLLTDEFIGLTEKANTLGIVMDEETVASMDTLGDTVGDLMNVGTALIGKVLTPFIPLLTAIAQGAMVVADVLGDSLGWAIDKIGEGLKWLSLQAISGLRSLLSMGQGITEMFPSLAGAMGLTDGLTNAMALLDSAEKALTTTKDEGTKATERSSTATRKLNLDYAGTKKASEDAAKALDKLKMTLPGVKESDAVLAFFNNIEVRSDNLVGQIVSVTDSIRSLTGVVANMPLTLPPLKMPQMSLTNIDLKGVNPLAASFQAWADRLPVGEIVKPAGSKIGPAIASAMSSGLSTVTDAILGALQGGGNALQAAAAALGSKIGAGIGGSIGSYFGGPAGKLIGEKIGAFVGSLTGKLFNSNDTKKDREAAAKMLGFSSLSAMNDALNKLGSDGQKLVHEGLNVIGKKDKAANDAWIASVKELFDKQKEIATKATEDAAAAQAESLAKITDPLKAKLKDIDAEYQKLSDSIAKEAPEEIMGVIEAQERAALADLEVQRKVTENELAAAETKVIDTATVIRDGIEHLFKDPIKVRFDWSDFPGFAGAAGGSGASFGGAMAEGGVGHVTRPTWFLAGEKPGGEDVMFSGVGKRFASGGGSGGGRMNATPLVIQADGRELARVVIRHAGEELQLGGY